MQLRTLALLGLLCAAFVCVVQASEPKPIRGIKSRDYPRYSQPQFVCFDQSATISSSQVNDDYCDCADGSDEPGTSACVNSRFWCANRGAKGVSLPSSRVNDGVCDCCDGTDELFTYSGVTCPNTCEDAGRAAKEALIAEIAATEAGVAARATLLATAQQSISAKREKYAKYEKLMSERKVLLEAAKSKKEAQEAVENEERNRRDAEKAAKEAAAAAAAEAAAAAAAAPATDAAAVPTTDAAGIPLNPDGTPDLSQLIPKIPDPYAEHHKIWEKHLEEVEQQEARAAFPSTAKGAKRPEKKVEETKEEEKKEEEKKENFPYPPEYAYQAADDKDKAKTEEKKENFPYPPEYAAPPAGGAAAPGSDEAHDEEEEYVEPEYEGDDGEEEGEGEEDGEDEEDAKHDAAAEPEAPYVHPDAEVARTEFSKIDKKVNRLQSKMDDLKKSLDRDYGTDGQFAHMDGQCFDLQVKQYTYEVCPYKSAAQKEGHSSTSLGSWSGIETAGDGSVLMKFTGGQTCWQGPARSLTVKLKCGASDALSNVEEPSKCVYEIQMQTPSVCNAQHAQVLRMNLEGGLIEEDEE